MTVGHAPLPRPVFASPKAYGERFTDVAYWRPYVLAVCARHALGPCKAIRAGLPGTHPVYVVEGRYAVKFFTHFFNGAARFAAEQELQALLTNHPRIPAPALIAQGNLYPDQDGWPWPYMVTEVIPGASLGEVRGTVMYADQLALAAYLGTVVRAIHSLPTAGLHHLASTWEAFVEFVTTQRAACVANHRRWASLPERLIAQIDRYVPPIDPLVNPTAAPRLLHADLNDDHLLGEFDAGHWRPTGVIDFGDARAGDPVYELIALHLGLFHCDKRLLRTFFARYDWNDSLDGGFVRRAMSYTLLFEFDAFREVFEEFPAAREAESLEALAEMLWDMGTPGLADAP